MTPLFLETLLMISTFYCAFSFMTLKDFAEVRFVTSVNTGIYCIVTAILLFSLLGNNFAFSYIAEHSHTTLPWFLKIAALWSGQEGSTLLLFLFSQMLLSLYFFVDKSLLKDNSQGVLLKKLLIFEIFCMNLYLLSGDLWTALLPFSPNEGQGLNPLLKDYAMTYHPPLLLFGQAGFFAASWIALLHSEKKPFWIKVFLKITLGILTLGITFGSLWAYHVLGWGGYWFWDPVETLSLIPWIVGFAILHAQKQYVSLTSFIWISVLLSLIVVRSNALVSVHAFGQNIQDNSMLLILLLCHTIVFINNLRAQQESWSLTKFTTLFSSPKSQASVFLFLLALIFLFAIFGPIVLSFMTKQSTHLGPAFYQKMIPPLILTTLSYLSLTKSFLAKRKITITFIFFLLSVFYPKSSSLLIVAIFAFSIKSQLWKKQRFLHLLLYIALLAIALNVQGKRDYEILTEVGKPVSLGPLEILAQRPYQTQGELGTEDWAYPYLVSYTNLFGLRVNSISIAPRQQIHREQDLWTSQMSFISHPLEEYGFILGEPRSEGKIFLKIYYNPFLNILWLSMALIGAMIAFEGFQKLLHTERMRYNKKSILFHLLPQ